MDSHSRCRIGDSGRIGDFCECAADDDLAQELPVLFRQVLRETLQVCRREFSIQVGCTERRGEPLFIVRIEGCRDCGTLLPRDARVWLRVAAA
jgi:hypothetical protein